jgi:hypothetical protein
MMGRELIASEVDVAAGVIGAGGASMRTVRVEVAERPVGSVTT